MKNTTNISPRVWRDTGHRIKGRRLCKSILGHYATESDGMYLEAVDIADAEAVIAAAGGEKADDAHDRS